MTDLTPKDRRPVVSTRERLTQAAREFIVAAVGEDMGAGMTEQSVEFAAHLLSSGAVEDRAEVEARALEAAADAHDQAAKHPGGPLFIETWWLRARASAIRTHTPDKDTN